MIERNIVALIDGEKIVEDNVECGETIGMILTSLVQKFSQFNGIYCKMDEKWSIYVYNFGESRKAPLLVSSVIEEIENHFDIELSVKYADELLPKSMQL